jgi:hypothetical protein
MAQPEPVSFEQSDFRNDRVVLNQTPHRNVYPVMLDVHAIAL